MEKPKPPPSRPGQGPVSGGPASEPEDFRPKTYRVEEAAKILGVCPSTVYKLARAGEIANIRYRGRVLILRKPLDDRLNGR